ncbi:LytR/AlgR family response regulator transcription factor [Mucilaginibacter sp. P19]|uniref:DNA-binding response regulator, LytR/AlgR family n=1 Tax=Mucilaginibacter gossypii TaxID=551996 RepID=A0A1G8D5C7_9SPHI|nr:LytTR family DNA-binding domain-containing protein [Mucilaginibacter gossypii]SDH52967.1 DNA-binding response regulator, LytR/AlgR family [Mucilaginibacter gossypii]
MNCIIIDDEPLARAEMESLIKEVSSLEILKQFSNAFSALEYLKENDVDLLFVDIQMPGLNGIDFAASVPKKSLTIFTTAYPQYALKSYELDAIDYVLKPIEKSRLKKAINKAELFKKLLSNETVKSTIEEGTGDFLFIKSERRVHKVYFDELLYVEGLKDYVVIFTESQKLITAMNLKNMHQRLPIGRYIRVSKSFVVNISRVTSFDNHAVYIGDKEVPLGETFREEFIKVYTGNSM